MTLKIDKRSLILISILLFLLLSSLLIFYIADNNLVRRVFFFPGRDTYSGEIRRVPRQKSLEDDIELFVNELILGPYNIDHLRVIPEDTRLQNLLLRNRSLLFIDFSADLIVSENELSIIQSDMLEILRENLRYNFPKLEEITLSVDGQTLQVGIK
ncbi:MAG: GerMN domain-containing protein [Spirochaetales bacterium]|nr:GerMN domain-containing protein [Spirochaetales bacterium]